MENTNETNQAEMVTNNKPKKRNYKRNYSKKSNSTTETKKAVKSKNKKNEKDNYKDKAPGNKSILDFNFKPSKLKIIALGGLDEIGKNITVFEYEDEMVIVLTDTRII